MKKFMKKFHRGQRGFTLIELLIVVAILGILAAVIIPNATGFMLAGRLNAANTEVANVKTAAVGFLAETGDWPDASTDAGMSEYYEGTLQAVYTFAGSSGIIDDAEPITGGWTGIQWDEPTQKWVRETT